jgi:hypothetical protein
MAPQPSPRSARVRSRRERFKRFRFDTRGTRFRIYLQSKTVKGFATPSIISVSSRPGTIRPGPEDSRIRVIDVPGRGTLLQKVPYTDVIGEPRWRPPYPRRYPRRPPVKDRRGHFDHLRPGSRAFWAANAFATVRCVLEIWEHYFGRRITWFFRDHERRLLEIFPRAATDNAWSGEGFLEFGYLPPPRRRRRRRDRRLVWLGENFDVVAHEAGHLILKSVIGNPTAAKKTLEYRAHEEGAADLVALVACLHFDPVVDRLLENTQGRLFSRNMLSRLGEKGRGGQLRTAFNDTTVRSPSICKAEAAYDKHAFSKLFTGAAFDVFVEIYERHLVRHGAIPAAMARKSTSAVATALVGVPPRVTHARFERLRRDFAQLFALHGTEFRAALLDARDDFARLLARTWTMTSVRDFPGRDRRRGRATVPYAGVVANMIAADRALGGRYGSIIRHAFLQRGISPAPRAR